MDQRDDLSVSVQRGAARGATEAHVARPSYLTTGILWVGLYLVLTVLPLLLMLIGPRPAERDFWGDFSAALGFVGLAMMCLQFVLTSRFQRLKTPYGSDIVYHFHREISLVAIGLILLHPVILLLSRLELVTDVDFLLGSLVFWTGIVALSCLLGIAATSLWRRRLQLDYDAWRRLHAVLAVGAVVISITHILLVDHYLDTPLKRVLWLAYTLAWIGLIIHVRLIKPARQLRSPYVVEAVRPERGDAYTLVVRPDGHAGFRFQPGQFAWLTLWDSPFSDREHPFSLSGSAEHAPRLEFTIKAFGDFTRRVKEVRAGQRAYVDGPHGALSVDRHPDAAGFVFVAGGIGITPFISQLRTLAERGDRRPVVLFYANRQWEDVTFREEIEQLRERLNLTVVHILSRPPDGWHGEAGRLSEAILRRYVPAGGGGYTCFICGPEPLMDTAEHLLAAIGVPLGDIDSERFNLV